MGLSSDIFHKIRRRLRYHIDYTGERVVPTEMHGDPNTWIQHLSRYVFALRYVVNCATLDIACGTGYGTSLLSSLARSVVGIDISYEAIKWAKKNNIFYCPAVFKVMDIERQIYPKEFDVIVCFETIEHLINPKSFLQNLLNNNLQSGGTFIFSVPLEDPPNRFHKQRYTWSSIEKLIKSVSGNNVEWYSQIEHEIQRGKFEKAKFAIGVSTKK